ncbi:MAG TPA: HDOD domain-containing protein [Candidatus Limnocylindria bacterium]|nr:HDOD domain-containing protein [Candidatus Limnocylindria bacterium]
MACPPAPFHPLAAADILGRVEECQNLPALSATTSALREILNGENQNTQQIAEAIRRDPSLTTRLLRQMNTVQFGLSNPVARIDQAVLYLGTQHVRELADAGPIMEELDTWPRSVGFNWKHFWQHCIGTAVITHELCAFTDLPKDDTPYLAGLLHDVGKIVMAFAFADHFCEVRRRVGAGENDLLRVEREVLGMDHAELGAHYLGRHRLLAPLIAAAKFHHTSLAGSRNKLVAAVQIANTLIRQAKLGHSGHPLAPANAALDAWKVLLPRADAADRTRIRQSIAETMAQLPAQLKSLA